VLGPPRLRLIFRAHLHLIGITHTISREIARLQAIDFICSHWRAK
jgi:hypothetical protein